MAIPSSLSEHARADDPPAARGDLIGRLAAGDPAALARCITLMESGGENADRIYQRICTRLGHAAIIGFTGAPGVGKSTLIDAYIGTLRARGHTVAVAAVDPSSPIFGGAILGDRVRMRRHGEDPGVFIRSLASRGHLGGLSESIHRIVDVMDAAGRDFIIIETVGTGQSEVEVAEIADICVVVNAPNMGDDVQAMKAGVLEIADVLVVNKADLPLARRTAEQLKNMLKLRREKCDVAVIETVATEETGIETLFSAIAGLATASRDKRKNRERRMRRLIAEAAGRAVRDLIRDPAGDELEDEELEDLVKAASSGEIGVAEAAQRALKLVR
ncbi:MAG TPA: methylmalonyl Co-A mutase-associated GTPase MeaB [Xanthobacteraceae bacterium]|nr:methylmalonyl Co-A mutase-associated GTPase MeaB [Xanthobacteraceae bacterium]